MTLYTALTYTLTANEAQNIEVPGGFIRFLSSTGATDLQLGIDGETPENLPVGVGLQIPGGFQRVRVSNPNAGAVTFEVVIAAGTVSDDRLNVSGTVSTAEVAPATQTPGTDKVILTGTTQSIAALAGRKECLVQADGKLRLSGITGKGFLWDGSQMVLTTAGAIDFFNDTAATVNLTFTEISA